jgi:hypothetical protein
MKTNLINDIVLQCLKHKIGCQFLAAPFVMADGIKCSGYFDEKNIVVATGKKDWLDVLVHESCHLDQHVEKCPSYKKGDRALHVIEDWLSGNEYSQKTLITSFKNNILMELDCERRTAKKIKKYKLKINTAHYIQQANSYLFSYWMTYKNRKWFPFPYNNQKIWSKMPKSFLKDEHYINPNTEMLQYFKVAVS